MRGKSKYYNSGISLKPYLEAQPPEAVRVFYILIMSKSYLLQDLEYKQIFLKGLAKAEIGSMVGGIPQ